MAQWRHKRYTLRLWAYKESIRRKKLDLPPKYCNYTMLIAWHKFDKVERNNLVDITGIELNKLPFTLIDLVWKKLLTDGHVRPYYKEMIQYPTIDYRRRILRAAMKEYRKHHRHRERIKV